MLEFLKGKKNHFIGIDFGTSSIKVVELSCKDQKAHLENYGVVDLNWAGHGDDQVGVKNASYEQKLNGALKELLTRMNMKTGNAYVSIPGFSGLITIIELPEMESEELAKAIQFEAHKYIPSSLDEIAMSWEIIDRSEIEKEGTQQFEKKANSSQKIKVLLVAAPKRDIERYDRLVSGTALEVSAIELETFSIARALVGDELGNFFVIDIGSRSTNIILVEKGTVRVNRNIDAGGNEITSAICDSMGVSRQRAEDFKRGKRDFLNATESAIVIPVLELIVGESQRILATYKEKNKDLKIDGIMLSGGSAKMNGLVEYFSRTLGVNVVLGNPWKQISFDQASKPLVDNLAASFTVSIGLALRGIEEYKRG